MSTKTEGRHNEEFLISEANGTRSRDQVTVTVPGSTTLKAGLVLSQLSATGKYVAYDNSGTDGTEDAAAILCGELVNDEVGAVDMEAAVINADAEVRASDLEWATGLSDNDKTNGRADLLALGIKAR